MQPEQIHRFDLRRAWEREEREVQTKGFWSFCSRAKQRQRNVKKKVCCNVPSCFLLIRPIVVFPPFSLPSPLSITRLILYLVWVNYKNIIESACPDWLLNQWISCAYSLIHLQFPPSERRQTGVSCEQNAFPVCCLNKRRNVTTNQASCSRNTQRRRRSSVWNFNR